VNTPLETSSFSIQSFKNFCKRSGKALGPRNIGRFGHLLQDKTIKGLSRCLSMIAFKAVCLWPAHLNHTRVRRMHIIVRPDLMYLTIWLFGVRYHQYKKKAGHKPGFPHLPTGVSGVFPFWRGRAPGSLFGFGPRKLPYYTATHTGLIKQKIKSCSLSFLYLIYDRIWKKTVGFNSPALRQISRFISFSYDFLAESIVLHTRLSLPVAVQMAGRSHTTPGLSHSRDVRRGNADIHKGAWQSRTSLDQIYGKALS